MVKKADIFGKDNNLIIKLLKLLGNDSIIYNREILPIISEIDYDFNNNFGNLQIRIINNDYFLVKGGKFFPTIGTDLFSIYNELLNIGYIINIYTVSKKQFKNMFQHSINYEGLPFCYNLGIDNQENFIPNINDKKHLEKLLWGYNGNIISIKSNIINNYKIIIHLKKNYLLQDINYKEYLFEYYFNYKLQLYKTLHIFLSYYIGKGCFYINDIFDYNEGARIKSNNFTKAINVDINKEYRGRILKVYDNKSNTEFKSGYIMIVKNIYINYLESAMKSKFICVETNSELSHSFIIAKELKLTLFMGCTGIISYGKNNQFLSIDLNKKQFNFK